MGRPTVYTGDVAKHIVTLVQMHGLTRSMQILNADSHFHDSSLRNLELVPSPLGICYPTLLKLSHRAGISFKRGRPRKEKFV